MAARLTPFHSLARQCRSFVCQQTAKLSSTTPNAKLDRQVSSADKLRNLGTRGAEVNDLLRNNLWSAGMREKSKTNSEKKKESLNTALKNNKITGNYVRHMARRWNSGELYSPHDLSPEEVARFRKPTRPKFDVLDVLGVNPLDSYQNFSMISEFVTPMGRIKHSNETCLRAVNQRRIAKAVRRAIGLGLHPSVHHHPELLKTRYANFGGAARQVKSRPPTY